MNDLNKVAVQKLIDKCPTGMNSGGMMADHLSKEFARINGIQLRIRSARLRSDAIRKKCDEEQLQIQKEIEVAQSQCQHEQTQDHRSGVDSSDNYTDCTICGKTL